MSIDDRILNIDSVICRHIDAYEFASRGAISQDILAQLRNFTEHIMLKFYAKGKDIDNTYKNICDAIEYVQTKGELRDLYRFHDFLEIVASHYTLDEENSERLMLKYYRFLLKIKLLVKEKFGLSVLGNLDKFPLNNDQGLQEYYEKIADKVDEFSPVYAGSGEKYYIHKIKPFFVKGKIYYEVTFFPANDYSSKSERVIAFTKIEITDYYASRFNLAYDSIEILGKTMPIIVIYGWEVSIRDCEFQNFSYILCGKKLKSAYSEQKTICSYLTINGLSLSDLMRLSDKAYVDVISDLKTNSRSTNFIDILEKVRKIVKDKCPGQNVLRYLLHCMNNIVIKTQADTVANNKLSNLYLQNGCIPFDTMPFICAPIGHNPRIGELFASIPVGERKHELLARLVKNRTEIQGNLFTSVSEIDGFTDISGLANKYNDSLWYGHKEQGKLVIENGQIFINGYMQDTCSIINQLKSMTYEGIQDYRQSVDSWLESGGNGVDCEEKKQVLRQMFTQSRVAVVYGSAGVGKTTLINHVANFWANNRKLFLAQTNPAVDNLKRRVSASNCNFYTIAKFLAKYNVRTEYDLLVIDECSTVNNKEMKQILNKVSFKLILLVGDTYQINSIRFGNWFSVIKKFIPASAVFEIVKPYRSSNEGLLTLWSRVRIMDDRILELIARQEYSATLDASIFNSIADEEIILCLNYDGLYGINNINRFLQENNENPSISWGIQQYKVGDPIIFNDSDRFAPVIYNNMKGKIVGIQLHEVDKINDWIEFDIEVPKVINGLEASGQDFELMGLSTEGNSIIRFRVYKTKSSDEDDSLNAKDVVPFQIAYAVSIHKAQGLEYSSVKIVITDEVDELITHNIFYTAITRARNNLKIYWSPEVENRVLTTIKPRDISKDVGILKKYILKKSSE